MSKQKASIMLTTADNPFDPFTQFFAWFNYDWRMGYNTCGWIDKLAPTSDNLTDYENTWIIQRAINELLDRGTAIGYNGASAEYVLAIEGQTNAWQ